MKKIAHENNQRNEVEDLALQIAPLVAQILVLLAPRAQRNDDLIKVPEAAKIGATSERVILDAIRAGELAGYGRQRDRSVRRGDLHRWIESRKIVHVAIDDGDIERRMARLRRAS